MLPLIATPVVRVAPSVVFFLTQRHWLDVGIPCFVHLLLVFLVLGLVLALLQLGLIAYVYEGLGLSRGAASAVLLAPLLGSAVNIPLIRLPAQRLVEPRIVHFFGMQYVVPPWWSWGAR